MPKPQKTPSEGSKSSISRSVAVEGICPIHTVGEGGLMGRVVYILDQARSNIVSAVNSNMVIAYWLIGREIVQALQGGEERAGYGRKLLSELSLFLTQRYGKGFSVTNLRYFRLFYQAYASRAPEIHHESGDELVNIDDALVLADLSASLDALDTQRGFSSRLGWTHYRTLCAVDHALFAQRRGTAG